MSFERVFALVPDCHAPQWRLSETWRRHFYDGLEAAGVATVTPIGVSFGWARPLRRDRTPVAEQRTVTTNAIRRQIDRCIDQGLDAVVSCCFAQDIDLSLVDHVRSRGVPWINFFCDSLHAFEWVRPLAKRTDLNWFVESDARTRYAALGVPSLCAPYAVNPDSLPDASCRSPEFLLSFVGAAHRDRVATVALLRLMGVDIHVGGPGWDRALRSVRRWGMGSVGRGLVRRLLGGRVLGHLSQDELVAHLRVTQVQLGLSQSGGRLGLGRPYLKLRDIEFPGMGCCYLAQHGADIGNAFDVGGELCTFRSLHEARSLVRELAHDPVRCRELGRRARRRVLDFHTWSARLPQIYEALG